MSERRRVLFVIDSLPNGGAERQMALLAGNLPAGWEGRVWSMGGGPFAGVLRADRVPLRIRERSRRLDVTPALDLWRVIARWRPHVVHSWGWMCTAAAAPICRLLGVPLIDGTIRIGMRPPRRALANRPGMACATRLIANSRAGLDAWGIPPRRGRVVYNGFDPDRLPLAEPPATKPDQPFTVVMTGRMGSFKDFRTFIGAAAAVREHDGGCWRFVAMGDGPDRQSLIAESRAVAGDVGLDFPQPSLEVLSVVRSAHVGVLMSDPVIHAEGCSNSIMEYMACGLPVVCSESGGNRELVADGRTGFIIPPRDSRALAEKLIWLRAHPTDAARMGARGRARILRDFSLDAMVEGTVDVYREVIR